MSACLVLFSLLPLQAPVSPPVGGPAAAGAGPSLSLADFDADGLPDVYVVRPLGEDRLLRNLGAGAFADVTASAGLAGQRQSLLATWQDVDGDGDLDLYVGHREGRSRLWLNDGGGGFADASVRAGVAHDGAELAAAWLDLDGDGLPDLHQVTALGDRLLRNLGAGAFEPLDLGLDLGLDRVPGAGGSWTREPGRPAAVHDQSAGSSVATSAAGAPPAASGPGANRIAASPVLVCAAGVIDAALGNCIPASTLPMLGTLMPLSIDFNVDLAGNVGIGTTTPGEKLTVAGTVHSTSGGYRFPDGTLQTSAASGATPWTQSGNDIHFDGGNVGVGTTTPTTPLEVVGSQSGATTLVARATGLGSSTTAVHGLSDGSSGAGVQGNATGQSGIGVLGRSMDHVGVLGEGTATTGTNYGVMGKASGDNGGAGVFAEAKTLAGYGNGLFGLAHSPLATAVYGNNDAQTGDAVGVHGQSQSPTGMAIRGTGGMYSGHFFTSNPSGTGVYGEAGNGSSGTTFGLFGVARSHSARGVYGKGSTPFGDFTAYGGYFEAEDANKGVGVFGYANSSAGTTYGGRFRTFSTDGTGVLGENFRSSGNTQGVRGSVVSPDGLGVLGENTSTAGLTKGVVGSVASASGTGILGEGISLGGPVKGVAGRVVSSQGWAGYFEGRGYFSGRLGLGTDDPQEALHLAAGGIRFPDDTVQTTAAPLTASGPAAGDLAGSYPSPTVIRLLGRSLGAGVPNQGDALTWTGSSWSPAAPAASPWGSLNHEVFVDLPASEVGIRTASPDHALHVSGGENIGWVPGFPVSGGFAAFGATGQLAVLVDEDEVQARGSDLNPGTLYVNPRGGDVDLANGTLTVEASSGDVHLSPTGGNVGIGTAAPTGALHVVAASGDGSVVLPDDAIGSDEMQDEPGLVSQNFDALDTNALGLIEQVGTRQIDAPGPGYVVVLGSATVRWNGPAFTSSTVPLGLSKLPTAIATSTRHQLRLEPNLPQTVCIQGVFAVNGGPEFLYMLVDPEVGKSLRFEKIHLTVMYFPTGYGAVDIDT